MIGKSQDRNFLNTKYTFLCFMMAYWFFESVGGVLIGQNPLIGVNWRQI